MKESRSVLIIIGNLRSGGSQKQAVLYANQLVTDHAIYMLILRGFNQTNLFFSYLLDPRVKQVVVKSRSILFVAITLLRLLTSKRFDYIVNFQPISNFIGTIFSKILRRKTVVVCTVRGNAKVNYQHIGWWKRFTDVVWVNSQQIAEVVKGSHQIHENKILLQHNLVETHFLNTSYKEGYILHVGRYNPVKNQIQLIKAFSKAKEKRRLELHLVGEIEDKSYYQRLISYVAENSIKDVFFHTKTNQIEHFYLKAEILILTSLSEGLPNVILEAQSYGVPVISSQVGDVDKLVVDKENGFLYDLEEESLVKCIYEFFDKSETEKLKLRENSIKKLEIFASGNNDSLLQKLDKYSRLELPN